MLPRSEPLDDGPPPLPRIAVLALGLALAVAVVAALTALVPAPVLLGRPRPCGEAQLVHGRLRCDEELLRALPRHCPGSERALAPGDVVEGCAVGRMAPEQLAALAQIIDLNAASEAELTSLPGIGPVLAGRIVAARPLRSVEALLEVRGIGPAKLAKLRARARVQPQPRDRAATRRSR